MGKQRKTTVCCLCVCIWYMTQFSQFWNVSAVEAPWWDLWLLLCWHVLLSAVCKYVLENWHNQGFLDLTQWVRFNVTAYFMKEERPWYAAKLHLSPVCPIWNVVTSQGEELMLTSSLFGYMTMHIRIIWYAQIQVSCSTDLVRKTSYTQCVKWDKSAWPLSQLAVTKQYNII